MAVQNDDVVPVAASQSRTVRSVPPEAIAKSVRAVCRRHDFPRVTIVGRLDLPAGRGIPLADGPVRRGRREAPAIRAKRDAQDLPRCALDIGRSTCRWTCPTARVSPIFAAGGDARSVRAEDKGPGITDFLGRGRPWFARIQRRRAVNPPSLGPIQNTASRDPSGLTAVRIGVRSLGPFQLPFGLALRRPRGSRRSCN